MVEQRGTGGKILEDQEARAGDGVIGGRLATFESICKRCLLLQLLVLPSCDPDIKWMVYGS
jgi:hypothetical protein